MRTPFLCLVGTLLAAPLAAQSDFRIDPHTVFRLRPNSCPAADSLTGKALSRSREPAWGWMRGAQSQIVSNDPFSLSGRKPIDAIYITATSEGPPPHPDAVFALQLRMKDSVLRQGASAELTLFFSDADSTVVGDMLAETTPWSTGNKVDQMLTQALRPSIIRALVAATNVRGRLGDTPFVIPPKTLDQIRSAFIAATCGADMR